MLRSGEFWGRLQRIMCIAVICWLKVLFRQWCCEQRRYMYVLDESRPFADGSPYGTFMISTFVRCVLLINLTRTAY